MVKTMDQQLPITILKPKRDKNLRAKHPWIFSGAIAQVKGKPKQGETVEIRSSSGEYLGIGAYSPESQIRVRLWTTTPNTSIDAHFFKQRIRSALMLRQSLDITKNNSGYRLINAESDGLPGLVVDRYNDTLVAQFQSCGVEYWKPIITEQLLAVTGCTTLYERSDVSSRKKEGLEETQGTLAGLQPEESIVINEEGRQYYVDVINGHKTGFYLDQRDNRTLLAHYANSKTVLNTFAYTGGFAVAALQGGAKEIISVDVSENALNIARDNIELNKPAYPQNNDQTIEFIQADVFKLLRDYQKEKRQFDVIILDPPKFAENKSQLKRAARGYKDINLQAFKLLKPGGLLFTFSCSGLMDSHLFQKIVADAALDAHCTAHIIKQMTQASDHPVALPFPEGLYLKGLICRKQ